MLRSVIQSGVSMKYHVYQEVTDWDKFPNTPNHRYIFNDKRQLVGYYPKSTNVRHMFSEPMKQWSSARRKMKKLYTFEE